VVRKSVRDVPETEGVLPRNREPKGRGVVVWWVWLEEGLVVGYRIRWGCNVRSDQEIDVDVDVDGHDVCRW
jgi:hypothetical protein